MEAVTAVGKGITLEQMGINLIPQEASNNWIDQKSIIVADPKVGKSTFIAQADKKSYFIRMATEFNGLKTYGKDCFDLSSVRREIDALHKVKQSGLWGTPEFPVENVVLDPMYRLMDYIADEVCEEAGNAPSIYEAGGYGVGQRKYKIKLKSIMRDFEELPAHKWYVFHSVVKEMKEDNDEKKTYQRRVIEMSLKLDFEITKLVNNTLHVISGYSGTLQGRVMVTQGTKFVEAGSKAPCLKKMTSITWTADDKANYDNFRKLFT